MNFLELKQRFAQRKLSHYKRETDGVEDVALFVNRGFSSDKILLDELHLGYLVFFFV